MPDTEPKKPPFNPHLCPEQSNVSLRDLFAAFALAGLLARNDDDGNDSAAVAFGYADKMLRIRTRDGAS